MSVSNPCGYFFKLHPPPSLGCVNGPEQCPKLGGCPFLRGSFIGGSTIDVTRLPSLIWALCTFLQYNTHREKMRQIDREDDVEKINRIALKIAREVADDTGTLMAGGICNSKIYYPSISKEKEAEIRAMFEEQVAKDIALTSYN